MLKRIFHYIKNDSEILMNKIISYVQNSKTNFVEIAEFVLEKIFNYSGITLNIIENRKLTDKVSNGDLEIICFGV